MRASQCLFARRSSRHMRVIVDTPYDAIPMLPETHAVPSHEKLCKSLESKYGPRENWLALPRPQLLALHEDLIKHTDFLVFECNIQKTRAEAYHNMLVKGRRLHQQMHRVRQTHGIEALASWGARHLLGTGTGRPLSEDIDSHTLPHSGTRQTASRRESALVALGEGKVLPEEVYRGSQVHYETWDEVGVYYPRSEEAPWPLVPGRAVHFGVVCVPWELHDVVMQQKVDDPRLQVVRDMTALH
eukprot:PhM_4_TR1643/c0_g1_i1/m.2666